MKWTKREDEVLRERYPTTLAALIAADLGRSTKAVVSRASELGLRRMKRPPSRWKPIGSERFDKDRQTLLRKVTDTGNPKKDWRRVDVIEWEARNGPVPPGMVLSVKQKGLPRTPENMAPAKTGLLPKEALPLGSERIQSDGLLYRKVSNTGKKWPDWKRVEVIEWEKVNGPIPKGYVLMQKDLSKPRTMDNLALFTREEHFARVSVNSMPEELRPLMQLKGQITQAIKRLAKAEDLQ